MTFLLIKGLGLIDLHILMIRGFPLLCLWVNASTRGYAPAWESLKLYLNLSCKVDWIMSAIEVAEE